MKKLSALKKDQKQVLNDRLLNMIHLLDVSRSGFTAEGFEENLDASFHALMLDALIIMDAGVVPYCDKIELHWESGCTQTCGDDCDCPEEGYFTINGRKGYGALIHVMDPAGNYDKLFCTFLGIEREFNNLNDVKNYIRHQLSGFHNTNIEIRF